MKVEENRYKEIFDQLCADGYGDDDDVLSLFKSISYSHDPVFNCTMIAIRNIKKKRRLILECNKLRDKLSKGAKKE
jgi:hypothetical protein